MGGHCKLCHSSRITLIHKGVRDNDQIDVFKCSDCGLVFLSDMETASNEKYYGEGGMHSGVNETEIDFDVWRKNSYEEDFARAERIREKIAPNMKLLDFGCGNGGFLKLLKEDGLEFVYGVELEDNARIHMEKEGICTKAHIEEFEETQFDYVTMFHVIEHLGDPIKYLKEIYRHLKPGGRLLLETPNADDALLSLYKCDAFADFTYWSCHVMLYNIDNLSRMLRDHGFKITESWQSQRYPFTNHLYWLSQGGPGGHVKWKFLFDDTMDRIYTKKLEELGKCDTISVECEKI